MSRIPRIIFGFFLYGVVASSSLPSWAKQKQDQDYRLRGKVFAISPKGSHWYQVATGDKVYLLICESVKGSDPFSPECKVNDKPIAAGDIIRFRVDGDAAYLPDVQGAEQELRVLAEELRVIHALPATTAGESSQSSNTAERAIVIGDGLHVAGDKHVFWSVNPVPPRPQTPKVKVPDSGVIAGSSGQVTPIAPAIPATPPTAPTEVTPSTTRRVTEVAVAPLMGISSSAPGVARVAPDGRPVVGGRPMAPIRGDDGGLWWAHILHVQVGATSYTLECPGNGCEIEKKKIELGDILVIRIERNSAFVTFASGSTKKEKKLRILDDTADAADPASK